MPALSATRDFGRSRLRSEWHRDLDYDLLTGRVRYDDTRGRMLTRDTPDGGTAEFAYDYQGNLRFSQDAQQAIDNLVSFTTYDSQNRPLVSGQASYGSAFTSVCRS